ncbi:MAG TPA: ABC transporter permease [Candidatus Paceibacterota bacterium]|jgi:putative ABC transport system permease protein|nr:ABC transporter permease [Candidatus Paceibacterota bacterium]
MRLSKQLQTAYGGLRTNRSRSLLTILGIVIGITAIMLVVSLGAGAQNLILSEVQGLGTQTIAVLPGREPTSPTDAATSILSDSLKEKDLIALRNKGNVPGVKEVEPIVIGAGVASYGSNVYQTTIFGTSQLAEGLLNLKESEGVFYDEADVQAHANVAVIGTKVADKLFDGDDPLNQTIKIKNRSLRVIGVLKGTGGSFINVDEMILTPYTTAQEYLLGINYFSRLIVEADDGADVNTVANDVKLTLRESHNISDPSKDDFNVQTQQELADTLSTITNALTYFLVAVAAIALFVGGIGIMNIMLVSVSERTREIGLRKALGATEGDILSQFLLESVLLTAVGGVIGIILGTSLAFLISIGLSKGLGVDWKFVFPWMGAALGFGVSALIGLIFGGYPARKAAQKSPIEALRYE